MDAVNFHSQIGKEVLIISSALDPQSLPKTVTIRGVDSGGIWIESQELTDIMLKGIGKTMFEGTPLLFVPFWRISLAFSGLPIPAIASESTKL